MRKVSETNSRKQMTRITEVEGRVASLTLKEGRLVQLTIADREHSDVVDFPWIHVNLHGNSLLDLLNRDLVNQPVKYTLRHECSWSYNGSDITLSDAYKLEVLDGPLQGVYTEKDFQL